MLKSEEIADPNSCWNKAASDEPVFVLRAQDMLAPDTIRHWVDALVAHYGDKITPGQSDKINDALAIVWAMEDWPTRRMPS